MKRLILLSIMFMFNMTYTEEASTDASHADQSTLQGAASTSDSGDVSISVTNLHQINLDNTDIDSGGNWLNKRIWYERSQAIFDDIRAVVNTVSDLRMQFSNEVNAVGQKIDAFYESITFTRTDLDDKFKEMLAALDAEQRIMGELSEEERSLQTSLKEVLPTIDQLGKDIKSIGEVDNKIDQTIMQAFKTIDECRELETKAWDLFKSIAKELDDKKTRNFYYQMSNYKQNIEQKTQYLRSTLLPYLHNVLVARIDMNISKINMAIEDLKKKGVDLEKIMDKTREDDRSQVLEREKAAADVAVKKALEEQQAKDKAEQEKLQKELELAKKNSFSNVMNAYYEATVGKISSFFHAAFKFFGLDSFAVYFNVAAYPVAIKVLDAGKGATSYGAQIFEHVMEYLGIASHASKSAEKSTPKVEEKKADIPVVQEAVKQDLTQQATTEHAKEVSSSNSEPAKTESSDKTTLEVKDAAQNAPSKDQANVVVQALSEQVHDTVPKTTEKPSQSYALFKSILDMIGTLIISLYNCVVQFMKMLLHIVVYVSSVS